MSDGKRNMILAGIAALLMAGAYLAGVRRAVIHAESRAECVAACWEAK